jgi:hypothetical protein
MNALHRTGTRILVLLGIILLAVAQAGGPVVGGGLGG